MNYDMTGLRIAQRRLVISIWYDFFTHYLFVTQYQPPAADEEGYNRITHDLVSIDVFCALAYCITSQNPASQNPASLTYDEVTINSDKV